MPLGRDSNLDSMSPSDAKLWWWRSSGYVWSNTGDFGRRRNVNNFTTGQIIKIRLDLTEQTVSFYESPNATEPVATIPNVEGPVVP